MSDRREIARTVNESFFGENLRNPRRIIETRSPKSCHRLPNNLVQDITTTAHIFPE